MKYLLKAGMLYDTAQKKTPAALALIKNRLCGAKKQIQAGGRQFFADIVPPSAAAATPPTYVLKNENGSILLSGRPRYAAGEDPAVAGWPLCHAPRVDAAELRQGQKKAGLLYMENSRTYTLCGTDGKTILSVTHRGLAGGWDIETIQDFPPEIVCGIFLFCRYLETENEFITV